MSSGISIVPVGFELTAHPVFFHFKPLIRSKSPKQEPLSIPSSSHGKVPVKQNKISEGDEVICGICLEMPKDPATLGSCSHSFCFECIMQWFHIKTACPICTAQTKYIVKTCEYSQRHPRGVKIMRLMSETSGENRPSDHDVLCTQPVSHEVSKKNLKKALSAHLILQSRSHHSISGKRKKHHLEKLDSS